MTTKVFLISLGSTVCFILSFCSRKDIATEIAHSANAPHGPGRRLYPGTCRHLIEEQRQHRLAQGEAFALRLNMPLALARVGTLYWDDGHEGRIIARPELFGDVVLARKAMPTSYHLAVTLDDHLQGVTDVVRGKDLFAATHIHRLLQALLDLRVPRYWHHPLRVDENGRRLAKRHQAVTLQALREQGVTVAEIRARIGLL